MILCLIIIENESQSQAASLVDSEWVEQISFE